MVQAWTETIAQVAAKDLQPTELEVLEHAVLRTNRMDAEICNMLARRPHTFHLNMLPTCQTESKADEIAQEVAKAHTEASHAKLAVFTAELRADWLQIDDMRTAKDQLRELLKWLDLDHKRNQSQLADKYVQIRMDQTHPVCRADKWDTVASQMSLLLRVWDNELQGKGGQRYTIIWVDFNTPLSRDALKLPSIVSCMASLAKVMDPRNTIAFLWMPNCPREGNTSNTAEDDMRDICAMLAKTGFTNTRRLRMLLSLHPSVAKKTSELEWFVDGSLAAYETAKDREAGLSNWWLTHSELARTHIVGSQPLLPLSKDLVPLTNMNENEDINQEARAPDLQAKCAQRGPLVAETQLLALLAKTPLTAKDEVVVVDLLPYVGDRALAAHNIVKAANTEVRAKLRHVVVAVTSEPKAGLKSANFTLTRITNTMRAEWFAKQLVLHDKVLSATGVADVPVHPCDACPPPTPEQLRTIKGGEQAYKGLAGVDFKVCVLQGAKVKIQPARLAEFQGATLEVQDALDKLTSEHAKDFEDMLSGYQETTSTEEGAGETTQTIMDGRVDDTPTPTEAIELAKHESEEALKAAVKITHTVKSAEKGITMYKDEKDNYYLMAIKDAVVKEGTQLGGIGGGSILHQDADAKKVWPWDMPLQDKTFVQLQRATSDDDSTAKKLVSGTLCSIARDIETTHAKAPRLTSFGELRPGGTAGRHQYVFQYPRDAEGHEMLAFVPSAGGAKDGAQAANFFAKSVHKDTPGIGNGALSLVWRLTYDSVGNVLKPLKPYVCARQKIQLQAGKPVRVAWPKEA